MVESLESAGVSTSLVKRIDTPTGRALVLLQPSGMDSTPAEDVDMLAIPMCCGWIH